MNYAIRSSLHLLLLILDNRRQGVRLIRSIAIRDNGIRISCIFSYPVRVIFCIYIECNNNYSETFDLKFQELSSGCQCQVSVSRLVSQSGGKLLLNLIIDLFITIY